MQKEKILIIGAGGRESAFAAKLSTEAQLYAVIGHANPTIIEHVQHSHGEYLIADDSDPDVVARFAKAHQIDYAFISADQPLANGVVDVLLSKNIKAVGGTRAATRIEWDKIYSINMMQEVAPEYTPRFRIVEDADDIDSALAFFQEQGLQIAVKPQGLTGGKGVKVMPEHLSTYDDCREYIKLLLSTAPQEQVLLVEKLEGIEFTIMAITDGNNVVYAPATYDYPYRFNGDKGPGTGGMGCFTSSNQRLFFMSDRDLADCKEIIQRVVKKMGDNALSFKGVLNGGFFKTQHGIKFMEFNSRFGDPESLNVFSVLSSSFSNLIKSLWHGTLCETQVEFINKASVVKYLVAKEYPMPSECALDFAVDCEKAKRNGVKVLFAACVKKNDEYYTTIKKSRVLALVTTSDYVHEAAKRVDFAIKECVQGNLEYRTDIGTEASLKTLKQRANRLNIS